MFKSIPHIGENTNIYAHEQRQIKREREKERD